MATNGRPFGLFWESSNSDRQYGASDFEAWLKKFFTTGVFLNDLHVEATSGMGIKVGTGYANVNGKVYLNESERTHTINPANSTYPRIDTVVITRNNTNRSIAIEVVTGAYAGNNPVPTAPVRTTTQYQLVLAEIYVKAGATVITDADITDTRADSDLCGIVACAVEKYDFAQWSAQFRSEVAQFKGENLEAFTAWFNHIKGQLSTDAAGHLQNEIDELVESLNASAIHYNSANSDLSATDVQSAIDEVKEITDDINADITNNVKPKVDTLEEELTANGNRLYMDYRNGRYGYNTSPTRGADTFHPFRESAQPIKLLSGAHEGSVDVSSYKDYQHFTVDNFVFRNIGGNVAGGYSGYAASESYNPSTGVYTFRLGRIISTGGDFDRWYNTSFTGDLYLIPIQLD